MLLKPNQRGTLTETFEAWKAAKEAGFAGIVSARSGETEDVTIVHLAVGWGVGQLKVGSFARGERMAKWNEALRDRGGAGGAGALCRRLRSLGAVRAGMNVSVPLRRRPGSGGAARRASRISDITVCPEHDDALLARCCRIPRCSGTC